MAWICFMSHCRSASGSAPSWPARGRIGRASRCRVTSATCAAAVGSVRAGVGRLADRPVVHDALASRRVPAIAASNAVFMPPDGGHADVARSRWTICRRPRRTARGPLPGTRPPCRGRRTPKPRPSPVPEPLTLRARAVMVVTAHAAEIKARRKADLLAVGGASPGLSGGKPGEGTRAAVESCVQLCNEKGDLVSPHQPVAARGSSPRRRSAG